MLQFGAGNAGQTAEIPLGEAFEICLAENPSTGFRWKLDSPGEPVCTPAGDEFQPDAAIGAPGTHRWRFRTARAGQCDIGMELRRAWAENTGGTRSFALHVVVEA